MFPRSLEEMQEGIFASLRMVAIFLCFTSKCCLWPDGLLVSIALQPVWLTVRNFFLHMFQASAMHHTLSTCKSLITVPVCCDFLSCKPDAAPACCSYSAS